MVAQILLMFIALMFLHALLKVLDFTDLSSVFSTRTPNLFFQANLTIGDYQVQIRNHILAELLALI
jgi:hypothetical protein